MPFHQYRATGSSMFINGFIRLRRGFGRQEKIIPKILVFIY